MALLSVALSLSSSSSTAALGVAPPPKAASRPASHISSRQPSAMPMPPLALRQRTASGRGSRRRKPEVICMAPEEEKMTRRSPLDFPIEWDRPKPGRRPDIFPQFSPMKTPLPPPLPADPPEEDEEEEEKKEDEEEDPEKEEPEKPENWTLI